MTAWYVPVARAVPAIALAVVITFTADHSASLGLIAFGIFALVSGAILIAFALRSSAHDVARSLTLVQGLVTVTAGIAALAVPNGGLPYLLFVVTTFGAITGFLELYLGLRSRAPRARGRQAAARSAGDGEQGTGSSRDWVFVGALTAVLALVLLLVPPGFSQPYTVEGVERELTASVIVVGTLGAYWAIIGVYLVIAGLSLKWSGERAHDGVTGGA